MKFIRKRDSWMMRAIGWFNPAFLSELWTTIGSTCYVPTLDDAGIRSPGWLLKNRENIAHEEVHEAQWKTYGPLFLLLYILVPLPVYYSYFRWKFEREAYFLEVRAATPLLRRRVINNIVSELNMFYFRPWPVDSMRRWLYRESIAEGLTFQPPLSAGEQGDS